MKKRKNRLTIRMVCAVYLLYLSYKLIRQLAGGEMSGKSFVVGVICVVAFILFGIFCIVTTWIELRHIDKELKEEQEEEASDDAESALATSKKPDPKREDLRHAGESETQSARIARLNALVEASMDDEEEEEEEIDETEVEAD